MTTPRDPPADPSGPEPGDAHPDPVPDPDLVSVVVTALVSEYRDCLGRIGRVIEGLGVDQLWTNPYGYGNSIGHLLLHLTGNLEFYIGSEVAGSGYRRDRPREFTESRRMPPAEVFGAFAEAVESTVATLERQSMATLALGYSAQGMGELSNRLQVFVNCLAHIRHHYGQMIYLRRELERSGATG